MILTVAAGRQGSDGAFFAFFAFFGLLPSASAPLV
jgi:hypothetical protein